MLWKCKGELYSLHSTKIQTFYCPDEMRLWRTSSLQYRNDFVHWQTDKNPKIISIKHITESIWDNWYNSTRAKWLAHKKKSCIHYKNKLQWHHIWKPWITYELLRNRTKKAMLLKEKITRKSTCIHFQNFGPTHVKNKINTL